MDLTIPRKNSIEFLLYIWKIINVPEILGSELLYRLSFDLYLLTPEKASEFIRNSIKNQHLKKNSVGYLSLSQKLFEKLSVWQKSRKAEIFDRLEKKRKEKSVNKLIKDTERDQFNIFINAFSEKGTSNRAATLANSAFNILEFDQKTGRIQTEVKGSSIEPYSIDIDINKKTITHNCHDFLTRRAENKKFCKHLIKLFLLLKEKNREVTIYFLKLISEKINEWDFSG